MATVMFGSRPTANVRPLLVRERCDGLRVAVDGEGQNDQSLRPGSLIEPLQRRHLLAAGGAPRRPEVDEHDLSPMLGEAKGSSVFGGDREILGELARRWT